MTKKQLKNLIRECILEVHLDVNEAAISSQEVAEKAFDFIKKTILGLSDKIKTFNRNVPLVDEQIAIIANDINEEIVEKLVKTKVIPCPIEFIKRGEGSLGAYSRATKKIELNSHHYLTKKVQDGYELLDPKNIDFDDMYDTIEHELIHQQQDERSKGKAFDKKGGGDRGWNYLLKKYDVNKDGKLDDAEIQKISAEDFVMWKKINEKDLVARYGDVVNQKQNVAPGLDDKQYISKVKYYNDPLELNTFAKDAANRYVKMSLTNINNWIKTGVLPNIEYSADNVKNLVLSPFVSASTTQVFKEQQAQPQQQPQNQNLRNQLMQARSKTVASKFTVDQSVKDSMKQLLMTLHDGYKFLNTQNRQKWWNYVYQSLLGMKFNPIHPINTTTSQ